MFAVLVAPEPRPPCQTAGGRPDLQTTPPDPRRCRPSDELRANLAPNADNTAAVTANRRSPRFPLTSPKVTA